MCRIKLFRRILHGIMCKFRSGQIPLIIIVNPGALGITKLFSILTGLLTHGQISGVDAQDIVFTGLNVVRVVLLLYKVVTASAR